MNEPNIRLHALNLGDRIRARFEHLFAAAGRGAGVLVNESVAEVVLADLDAPDAAERLAEYRRRQPGQPALLLSRQPAPAAAHDQVLLKPLEIRALLVALLKLRTLVDQRDAPAGDGPEFAATFPMPRLGAADLPSQPGSVSPPVWSDGGEPGHDEYTPTVVMTRRPAASLADVAAPLEPGAAEPATVVMPRRVTAGEAVPLETAKPASAGPAGPVAPACEAEDPAAWVDRCGDRPDVDPHDDEAVAGLWVGQDGLLLGRLAGAARQALDTQRTLELRAGNIKIVVDGASDYAYADNDEASVRALCAPGAVDGPMTVAPAGKPKAVLLSRSGNPTAHWSTVESAVWQAALWTYRGRLPAGTALNERVYLSRWPNFTRLAELPHALRICALWIEQPVSLATTASLLGLPQRYVFALYGATHALGLSGPARRGADHLFASTPALLVPHRPLLGRLVQHLSAPANVANVAASRAAG